ncbi:hypothetical protein AG1IA_07895 [Rhizoctonia solani AG-1 IA]|uniref:Uncharacterized protein n=1 Tax=Thanatephorus cucumeris (strain AG1-IA) TaxID=983506 RepID=L8WMP5_THACA|nr:hypothetical protein AG1IA_07895 [Rhizoctonia solani AG-1 IA]
MLSGSDIHTSIMTSDLVAYHYASCRIYPVAKLRSYGIPWTRVQGPPSVSSCPQGSRQCRLPSSFNTSGWGAHTKALRRRQPDSDLGPSYDIIKVYPCDMKFFNLVGLIALSVSVVSGSPASNLLGVNNYCSGLGEKCNGFHACCSGFQCKGAGFKRTCEDPSGPDCTLEGRPCSDFSKCCAGLTCQGAAFKRTCSQESTLYSYKDQ